MDSVHNLSDEVALLFLYLALVLPLRGFPQPGAFRELLQLCRTPGVSSLLVWQALERVVHAPAVSGVVPIVVGLGAAAGNWGVARAVAGTWAQQRGDSIAYVHNVGDVLVSLGPVLAGPAHSAYWKKLLRSSVCAGDRDRDHRFHCAGKINSGEELVWPEEDYLRSFRPR